MKIGIVSAVPVTVEILRAALCMAPRYLVVWVARCGAEALEYCAQHRADMVLMDLNFPDTDGVEAWKFRRDTDDGSASEHCAVEIPA
jgi:two-component system response regulator WspF